MNPDYETKPSQYKHQPRDYDYPAFSFLSLFIIGLETVVLIFVIFVLFHVTPICFTLDKVVP